MIDATLFERHSDSFCPSIGLYYCGKRLATKNHVYGPEIRLHYCLVYVEEGDAFLYCGNKKIPFGKGQMLVMFPGEKIFYKAQTDWTIRWIGVNGKEVDELFSLLRVSKKHPIWTVPKELAIAQYMENIYELQKETSLINQYKTQALLFQLFGKMLSTVQNDWILNKMEDAVTTAKNIIAYNYNNHLEIESLAQKVFLSPAYFSRLFKEKTGVSPKQYIVQTRLEKAKELLRLTKYSIKNISLTVGFKDPLYFSRLFTKYEKSTPMQYRKQYFKKTETDDEE